MIYDTYRHILDWSEAWAPLIPLIILAFVRKQPSFLKPIIIYLCIAFPINVTGNIIADYKKYFPPELAWIKDNLIFYNVHSILRAICFGYFFALIGQKYYTTLKKVLTVISSIFIIFTFIFIEPFYNPDHLNANLLATEAYLLLIFCMLYYLSHLKDDIEISNGSKDFWIVTGLCIYVVINFFVFLFYVAMIKDNIANDMWDIHNIAYIILCIFIAKAFYVSNTVTNKA